ncbi:formate dehydrogenase (NADP+) beta subunit [Burkholderiales bacterium]|nr:formate dehydrogenase (NADP+) beta subunit [Burkholderiales bacterium]
MSEHLPQPGTPKTLSFRRYRDGDAAPGPWQKEIFDADHSHKCPTYVLSSPPCQANCPSGEDIRGYLDIVRGVEKPPAGVSWQEYAFQRLTEANPFPAVMGRVCPAPCEKGCNRNEIDDHVGINAVEHFLGEYAIAQGLKFTPPAASTGKKVAVIGGGPAGLSCAYHLARRGHAVTIFDQHEALGGMMRYGIPGFRTPREVLDAEIQRILDLGVQARLNCRVGSDISIESLHSEFDAVFFGLGAQSGRPLPVPGADAPNCVNAIQFLRAFNDGRMRHVGKRVVVVGGGDTSIDVATVARRLGHISNGAQTSKPEQAILGRAAQDVAEISARQGAEVTLTSVFTLDKMQASRQEIEHAQAEGIVFRDGYAPIEVLRDAGGRATALRIAKCEAKFVGAKLEIKVQPGSEIDIPADLVVSAIGQAVDFTGLETFDNGKGGLSADRSYQVEGKPGHFAGGDVLRPHLLTSAIGQGRIAAEGIDRFLAGAELGKRPRVDVSAFAVPRKMAEKGLPLTSPIEAMRGTCDSTVAVHNFEDRSDRYVIRHSEMFLGHFQFTAREKRSITQLGADQVLGNFAERIEPLSETSTVTEAKRCMSCGLCFECDNCVIYCPQKAVFKVPKAKSTTGRYVDTDYNKCIGCHICHDVCPTGYIQMGLGE